ncbi:MAG: hypothetical protein C0519_09805 [Hyphomicrobium sp.]|nr:hypothetical protein [Hyphomicrobium sp.]
MWSLLQTMASRSFLIKMLSYMQGKVQIRVLFIMTLLRALRRILRRLSKSFSCSLPIRGCNTLILVMAVCKR